MSGSAVDLETTPPVHPPRRLWLSLIALLAGTVVLIWSVAGWRARAASAQVRSLAVLPFTDLSNNVEPWLAGSITGEVIDTLSQAPGLQVIGRTSAYQAKGDAGKQLGVAAIIEGTVEHFGDQLHLTLTMTRTSDHYRLWTKSFDSPADGLRKTIEEISAAIGHRLQVNLPKLAAKRHQPSTHAYNIYLQGRYFFDQATPEALNQAEQRLEAATDSDPDFVPAWAWLSIVREYRVAAGMARPNQGMPGSRDAAERATALGPDCGLAQLALGIVHLQYDWDWAGAKEQLDRAVKALPGSAFAAQWRARWYQIQGRMNEAMAETQRAAALDPLSPSIAGDAASQYVWLNQPDRAIPFAQKAVDLNPGDARTQAALANVLWLAGQRDKAKQIVSALHSSGAAAKLPPSVLATLDARMGETATARQLLNDAEDLPDDQLRPAVEYAGLAGVLQDWDRLFSWTEEAYGERDLELPYWRGNPLVPKSDPRYDAFLAQMNLPSVETH